jgi:hypothetical protein
MLLRTRSIVCFSIIVGLLFLFYTARSSSLFPDITSKNENKNFESPEEIPLDAIPVSVAKSQTNSSILDIRNATLGVWSAISCVVVRLTTRLVPEDLRALHAASDRQAGYRRARCLPGGVGD